MAWLAAALLGPPVSYATPVDRDSLLQGLPWLPGNVLLALPTLDAAVAFCEEKEGTSVAGIRNEGPGPLIHNPRSKLPLFQPCPSLLYKQDPQPFVRVTPGELQK